jgi:hypothetical protein
VARFSVLPGDSAFLVRTVVSTPRVIAEVPAAIRGRRANNRVQRELAIVAAHEVSPLSIQQYRNFEGFALDPRAYVLDINSPFAGYILQPNSCARGGQVSVSGGLATIPVAVVGPVKWFMAAHRMKNAPPLRTLFFHNP